MKTVEEIREEAAKIYKGGLRDVEPGVMDGFLQLNKAELMESICVFCEAEGSAKAGLDKVKEIIAWIEDVPRETEAK